MKKIIKKVVLVLIIVVIMSSFTQAQFRVDGNYFSTEFKAGTVLKWEYTLTELEPEKIVYATQDLTISILQDVTEGPITPTTFQNYFYISYNGLNYTNWFNLLQYIFPYLLVLEGTSYTVFEQFAEDCGDMEDNEVKHSYGNTIWTMTLQQGLSEWTRTTKIDDETGIVRENTIRMISYGADEVIISDVKHETIYVEGIELTNVETSGVLIVIISIPLVYVLKKRRKNHLRMLSQKFQ